MGSHHVLDREIRRRASATDRAPIEPTTPAPTPGAAQAYREPRLEDMPPPPRPPEMGPSARRPRSDSAAFRITNRLSLTLPIAPPTTSPTPPAPVEPSTAASPPGANELIIAIAAQERKVLELREELARAEAGLVSLKKHWTAKEAHHKRAGNHRADLPTTVRPSALDPDAVVSRRSVELDRRRLLLQNQNQGTPVQSRRTVLRGGHTRALSLLTPTRLNSDVIIHEDHGQGEVMHRKTTQSVNPALPNPASWQSPSVQNPPSMPQIVQGFKSGLRAFVEDMRQITVGDEPTRDQPGRGPQVRTRDGSAGRGMPGDQEILRAGHAGIPKTSTALHPPSPGTATPTPAGRTTGAALEGPKPRRGKHFSWTPLGFDSWDDNDWSNWDSPGVPKSPSRWSGSTTISAELDDIRCVPEVREGSTTPVRTKPAAAETPILAPKLGEILPSVVNKLSPSNLTRTANSLMDEWEKSLVAPEPGNEENQA